MVYIVGKYQHERNENLDEYFRAVGVPFIPRKMMCSTSPQLDVFEDESGEWTTTSTTFLRTIVTKFRLGEEYEENMPGGVVIKSTTTKDGDKLITVSVSPDGAKVTRTYDFDDTHCTMTLRHETSGTEAKRFFKRI